MYKNYQNKDLDKNTELIENLDKLNYEHQHLTIQKEDLEY